MNVAATAVAPDLIARVSDLELVARIIVEGLVSGLHRSPFHGYSAEFSQYRHYRPGDDLKYIDWKLVARTDRVYTKQFRETTDMAAALVLDTSASMAFPQAPVSKFVYARMLAAALGYLISSQGDSVGLVTDAAFLPARSGRHHLRRLLAALSAASPQAGWRPAETVRRAAERLGRRGLLFVLSDFYDDEEATLAELRRAARMGHEVAVLQVISRDEIEFRYQRDAEFVDLETGRSIAVDAAAARRSYTDGVSAFLEAWRRRAGAEAFQYALMVCDVPPDRALRSFLAARQNRQRP